jgi:hypothetical protein
MFWRNRNFWFDEFFWHVSQHEGVDLSESTKSLSSVYYFNIKAFIRDFTTKVLAYNPACASGKFSPHGFRELVKEYPHVRNKKRTWNYGIGCILGELSGPLFPETQQERQQWAEECCKC